MPGHTSRAYKYMRNSFSLPVYFPQVVQCDVKILSKTVTASRNMKLIPLIILTISLAAGSKGHESFTFPPKFHGQHSGMYTSEKQFYLPPESHTAIPYFPMKNFNNLPFPYLPPTATKAPSGSPSPYPLIISTTLLPMKSDDDDDDDDDKSSSPLPPYLRNQYNRTQRGPVPKAERREMRLIPKNFQHPIDRIDTKLPFQFNSNIESSTQSSGMQSMSPRSIMISDIQRDINIDQMKAASYQGSQYVPQPGVFISTTETAIPILRLSNEMDLDGSFSYEALGADQTHYVQHSRMENTGSDKEEQVVEGSYSYVGDNGKTYTVHYIADSNGFRASGDHLPVPPPVPEIIQRAVQYNIAEELKKPPQLKSWNEVEKENELSESERRHRFAVSPPRLSSLFTGKTPESFSHSFSQASNTQNNLVSAASSQTPIQTVDYTDQMQNKQNSGTISPQITFLASQGAHVPSVNAPQQQQQNIARIFTTERPTMPQIVNYEANIKDSDQESNKALWRWQYGMNANLNQNMEKNLISRSFGEDDISINFSDMTADQYTKMLQERLEPNKGQSSEIPHQFENSKNQGQFYNNLNSYSNNANENTKYNNNNNFNTVNPVTSESQYSTERITPSTHSVDYYAKQNNYNKYDDQNLSESQDEVSQTSRPKLITQDQFIPRSQTVTQTYSYDDNGFESRRTKMLNKNNNMYEMNLNVLPLNYEKSMQSNTTPKTKAETEQKIISTQEPPQMTSINNIKFTDFIVPEDKSEFKPIFAVSETVPKETTATTTEPTMENMLEENMFLKNLFRNNKNEQEIGNKIKDENKNLQVKPIVETRTDKYPSPKYIQFDQKPYNEIKTMKKKPIDISEIVNYLSRNQFESNKVRSKPKQVHNNFKQKNEMQYFTPDDDQETAEDKITRHFRTLQQQEELRGAIKNYKVLQRNNHLGNTDRDDIDGLRRDLSPPPVKVVNLPPLGRAGPTMKSYLPPVYV